MAIYAPIHMTLDDFLLCMREVFCWEKSLSIEKLHTVVWEF